MLCLKLDYAITVARTALAAFVVVVNCFTSINIIVPIRNLGFSVSGTSPAITGNFDVKTGRSNIHESAESTRVDCRINFINRLYTIVFISFYTAFIRQQQRLRTGRVHLTATLRITAVAVLNYLTSDVFINSITHHENNNRHRRPDTEGFEAHAKGTG